MIAARDRQTHRLRDAPETCNAQLTPRQLREYGRVSSAAQRLVSELYDAKGLSARGHTRILRVARTVADLEGSATVEPVHVDIAAGLRLERAALSEAA